MPCMCLFLNNICSFVVRLLIWEECHYESTPHLDIPFGEWDGCWGSYEILSRLRIHAEDRVQLLINKMMNNNQVNVLGEGYASFSFS